LESVAGMLWRPMGAWILGMMRFDEI
jgi:hypothetical protein